MSMPTTCEGWLKAVKECDLLNARSLAIELSVRFGESNGIYYNALSRARGSEKISNMQQSYAKALHEHLSPKPSPIAGLKLTLMDGEFLC